MKTVVKVYLVLAVAFLAAGALVAFVMLIMPGPNSQLLSVSIFLSGAGVGMALSAGAVTLRNKVVNRITTKESVIDFLVSPTGEKLLPVAYALVIFGGLALIPWSVDQWSEAFGMLPFDGFADAVMFSTQIILAALISLVNALVILIGASFFLDKFLAVRTKRRQKQSEAENGT